MSGLELLKVMIGEACWHVSAGGATAPSFLLVMGDKVPRSRVLANPNQPDAFRRYRGSIELLVWSSWRLQTDANVLATSDQGETGVRALTSLTGAKVTAVSYAAPAWDLRIDFSNGQTIATFSDHVEPDASIAENWEFWNLGDCITAGPGTLLQESAENSSTQDEPT